MNTPRSLMSLGLLTCVLAVPASSQEWTQFRGPNGSGISKATTVPETVTPENTNWKVQLPGVGHSAPVVWGDHLYVTSVDDAAGKRYLHCLNTGTGKAFWSREYPYTSYTHHKFNNGAAGTPAVDKDAVYFTWTSPDSHLVLALDHSGKELWRRDLGKHHSQHGGASSPVLFKDLVIVRNENDEPGPGSSVVGLDRKSGAVRWNTPRQSKAVSYSLPVIYQPAGGQPELILSSQADGICSLNPLTGEVNWEARNLFRQRTVAAPALLGGLIFASAGNGAGERQGIAVVPGGKGKAPEVKYQISRGVPYVPAPIVLGERMFMWSDAGIVTCVKADTGEALWSERVGGNYFGSPVCVNGKLYAMSAQGDLVVVEAGDQFKLLGRSSLGELSHSTPSVANGVMYLRTERHLISFGGKK